MSKYRIYELAKEFDTTSKVIIDILSRNNMSAKNHMSSVDEDAKNVIVRTFARKTDSVASNKALSQEAVRVKPQTAAVPTKEQAQQVVQPQREQQRPTEHFQQRPAGDANQRPTGNTQQRPTGNYQQRPTGDNQQRPVGNFQQRPAGDANQRPTGNAQQRPAGNYQQRPAGDSQQRPAGNFQQRPVGDANQRPMANNQQRPAGNYQQRPAGDNQQRLAGNFQQRPNDAQRPAGNFQQRPTGNTQQRPANGNFQQRPTGDAQQRPAGNFQQRPAGNFQQRPPAPAATNNSSSQPSRPAQNQQRPNNNRPPHNNAGNRTQNAGHHRPQQHGQGRHQNRGPVARQTVQAPKPEPIKPQLIQIGESITVKDLAVKLAREVSEVIKKLMMLGIMATINQEIDFDTASILGSEFGTTVEPLPPEEDPTEIPEIEDEESALISRSPVVTVMGHVDHGKTSLLDAIRKTHVTSQEAGGITQHIGAYQVVCHGKKIVFLDTPGHEAFTAMRARGAQVTDVAILVVAADDGVMPQTIEAINHAKAAEVPIIVAINKMDRAGANPDRVKQQLSDHGLIPEDWGGDTIMVPVSAHQKTGISDLLEMILLVAEVQDLKANPNRKAYGTIIEAQLDKGRGPVATVLVQKGTLRIGDTIIAGTAFGKVRAMINDRGEKVKKAEPSTPVEVLGLAEVPAAGDVLVAVDEKVARAVAEKRVAKKRTEEIRESSKVSLEDLFQQIQDGNIKDLNIVIKGDVHGSVEALRQSLLSLKNKEVRVNVVHAGVGAISESDVMLASAANALIIGFNVRPDVNSRKAAEAEKIDIRIYRVIYEAINDVEAAMTGMLAPEFKEVIQGRIEVRQLFTISKVTIAGSYVLEGKVFNSSQVRLIRDGIVIYEGKIESLRRFKDDVKEVATGYECGVTLDKFRDLKEGDIIEAFTMEEVKPKG